MQNTINGFFYIALPDETMNIIKEIQKTENKPISEIIANSIKAYAEKVKK